MTQSQANAGFDAMKNFMNPEYFMNAMKQAETPDLTQFTDNFKKGTESLTHTTQVLSENAQALVRRAAEIAQTHMTESFNAIKDMTAASGPEEASKRHQDYMKSTMERVISDSKEMAQMASKSAIEVFDVVGKKAADSFNHCTTKTKK